MDASDGDLEDRRLLRLAVAESHRCPPSRTAFSVGALIVAADGTELARGHSRQGGDPGVHAEEAALAAVADRDRLATATLYSSLEPCSTRSSRARSCTELILAAGLRRVVFAWREPLLFQDCQGAELLTAAGVEVIEFPDEDGAVRAVNAHLLGGAA